MWRLWYCISNLSKTKGYAKEGKYGKFVNFTEENGRKVNRPNNCKKNIYLYGGSTTFGYNVTDEQTIGQYIQNFLNDEYCIYNHGRAYYYSKQENHLFFLHIENKKKIDYAIFLDGINERCGGYEYQNQINYKLQSWNKNNAMLTDWMQNIKVAFIDLETECNYVTIVCVTPNVIYKENV